MRNFIGILCKAFIMLIFIRLALIAAPSIENNAPLKSATINPVNTNIQDPQSLESNIVIEGLRAQNELLKSFDQRLLATVYWAFGFLGTVAIALFAFGWWTNARVNNREFRALASEIRNQYLEEGTMLKNEIALTLSERIDARVKTILESDVTPSMKNLEATIDHISEEILEIAIEREIKKAESSIARGVFSNGVHFYSEAAGYAIRKKDIFRLQTSLEGILSAFRASKAAGAQIEIGKLHRIELFSILDRAPKQLSDFIDAIRVALKDSVTA